MLFTLVTPTKERHMHLIMRYQQLLSQSFKDWEWRILDSSYTCSKYFEELKAPNVFYTHTQGQLSVGEKRNWLKEKAKGEWVVHCDDDDYYAPNYLTSLLSYLSQGEFIKAYAWYAYDKKQEQLYYVDAKECIESYYHFDPMTQTRVREVFTGECVRKNAHNSIRKKNSQGYGFSFVYHREKTQSILFKPVDIGEDIGFYRDVSEAGLKQISYAEREGTLVKRLSEHNLSQHYPQYRLPAFVMNQLMPHYLEYLKGDMT